MEMLIFWGGVLFFGGWGKKKASSIFFGRKWVKEEFGSPAGFFCALDANKKGKAGSSKKMT